MFPSCENQLIDLSPNPLGGFYMTGKIDLKWVKPVKLPSSALSSCLKKHYKTKFLLQFFRRYKEGNFFKNRKIVITKNILYFQFISLNWRFRSKVQRKAFQRYLVANHQFSWNKLIIDSWSCYTTFFSCLVKILYIYSIYMLCGTFIIKVTLYIVDKNKRKNKNENTNIMASYFWERLLKVDY